MSQVLAVRTLGILLAAGLASTGILPAGLTDGLNAKNLEALKNGQQVVLTETVEGFPWPRYAIYKLVNSKPEEAIAVFCDYNNAREFIPNVKLSKISKQIGPRTQEVSYSVDVPILPDECYTTRNSLTGDGSSFRVDWTLLQATSMKSTEGSFSAEPFGDDQCLIRYQNLVDPGSKFAGLLRSFAGKQIEATVTAITTEIETQKTEKPEELKKKVDKVSDALRQ